MQVKCSDIGGNCDTVFEDRSEMGGIASYKCPVCGEKLNVPKNL